MNETLKIPEGGEAVKIELNEKPSVDLHNSRELGESAINGSSIRVKDTRCTAYPDTVAKRVARDINNFLFEGAFNVSTGDGGEILAQADPDKLKEYKLTVEALAEALPKMINAAISGHVELVNDGTGGLKPRTVEELLYWKGEAA